MMRCSTLLGCAAALLLWSGAAGVQAAPYPLPVGGDAVIGRPRYVQAGEQDTLVDIGREYSLGYDQIIKANPNVNRWVPGAGNRVLLPTQYVLPDSPWEGIVLNLPELRLYYFPPVKSGIARVVHTFPVSVGRMDWKTPLGVTKVVRKDKDPPWYPTKSIREEHAAEGDVLPAFIAGGAPDNPLGRYALRLGLPSYLIHGVDERKAYGIGMQVTHGCVRMFPDDIEQLFQMVTVKTPVAIIDQPVKAGWLRGALYLEVHTAFEEEGVEHTGVSFEQAMQILTKAAGGRDVDIDQRLVEQVIDRGDGVPTVVGQLSPASLYLLAE